MQKFTRALTREIEVGGERLAVTLAEDGVTVRPVGSRRPPCQMGWPAVVRALAGKLPGGETPTSGEIEEALEALRAGAKPAPTAAAPAKLLDKPATSDVPELLERLDAWLAGHRPGYHSALQPGAGAGDLEGLAKVTGKPLPDELRQWLRWHNGQDDGLVGSLYGSFNLMSAAQIAAAWQDRQATATPGWDAGWIPLLDDYQDDLIVLDPSQPGCAVREVWRGREDHEIIAPTLAAWLARFVGDVEAGRYLEDPERGEFQRASAPGS